MKTKYSHYVAGFKKQAYSSQELAAHPLTTPWYRPCTKVLGKVVRKFWAMC